MTEFVLVHGTTQSPAGWDRLAAELREHGHDVITIHMPTDRPDWSVADYARHAAAQADKPADDRAVVGHSGAGVLLPAIAEAISASAAVWLAAYVPDLDGGRSMLDDIKDQRDEMFHPDWLGVDPTADPRLALRFLFHDCDQQTSEWALSTLRCSTPVRPSTSTHRPRCLRLSAAPA